jgi:lipoprotein-anchoring transpeptidase ErfK/SrfK
LVNLKSNRKRISTVLASAFLVALTVMGTRVSATDRREHAVESIKSRTPGEPILAIVSLRNQRITVYDANGWILRAPVSSGQRGRETPAGIFSVIQKDAEHYSNIYDDAYMPNMQRLTWSGIALHGGVVPGYPASHGCVRMPFEFAERLFDVTQLGLRVIVSPTDIGPNDIVHPLLSRSKSDDDTARAAAVVAQADEAARKADEARRAAGAAFREATQAMVPVRAAENLKIRAKAQLEEAEAALSSPTSDEAKEQAERSDADAKARIADLDKQSASAKAALQPKLDALNTAREAALSAEKTETAAADAARQAARAQDPISVLISRKTQRLYIRRDFEPIFETPVEIADPDRPIGTFVFTAMEKTSAGMRWSVVSLNTQHERGGLTEDPDSAKAALDRIVIPQEALDRISWTAARSSLIITDEALSPETSKGTDFVVLLSGEPQGGIKMRQRAPAETDALYAIPRGRMPDWHAPFVNSYSTW